VYCLFLTWMVNANSLKAKHYSYYRDMSLAATFVAWMNRRFCLQKGKQTCHGHFRAMPKRPKCRSSFSSRLHLFDICMFILSRTARWCQYLINSAFLSFFWGCQKSAPIGPNWVASFDGPSAFLATLLILYFCCVLVQVLLLCGK